MVNASRHPSAGANRFVVSVVVTALVAGLGVAVFSQPAPAPNKDAMYEHIKKAQKLAGADLSRFFYRRCLVEPAYSRTISSSNQAPAAMEPVKVMDKLYFLGQNAVSSWALETSEGFVIFDTLNNAEEAKQYIEGGMVKLGLDPKRIKYIVITHEHGDHFAGTNYLKEISGARVVASTTAWDLMAAQAKGAGTRGERQGQAPAAAGRGGAAPARSGPPADWAKLVPARDIEIRDGQTFVVGDTTMTFYVTPGHAQGTLSTIIKTTDHGAPHVIGFNGGLGSVTAENRAIHIASLKRWRGLAAAAGVDTLIANHQTQDGAVENLELVKVNRPGDQNPFVLGKDGYLRYIDINIECTYANMARAGQEIK
jgi:metallo-beta-lactamase class B